MSKTPLDWLSPDSIDESINSLIGTPVHLVCDFGVGDVQTRGRAYRTVYGMVFADCGGWCTQYVKRWARMRTLAKQSS